MWLGHIEDIVVDTKYRGMGLGKKIITHLTERAKELECYKIILDCAEKNTEFYQKCGFSIKGIQMSIYY